jgi:Zn-dependent protease
MLAFTGVKCQTNIMIIILSIIILVFSVIIHEVAHGYMALWMGDPTAEMQGRLTLNPLRHIDPVGSIIVPIITSFFGFTFGWAKPVEYNPYNLKNKRVGELSIALAGPASNLLLAIIFGMVIRIVVSGTSIITPFVEVASYIVIINIVLALFNLIPLPPLDGSKILYFFLPRQYGKFRHILESYAPLFIMIVVFFVWELFAPVIPFVFKIITGIGY